MKKILIMLVVFALAVSMVSIGIGCKTTTTETTAAETTAAETTAAETTAAETTAAEGITTEPVTLNYWIISGDPTVDAITNASAEYTAAHPNVTFKANVQDNQGIKDIIQSALTTQDETLDWSWYLTGAFQKPLVDAGLLMDLTPYAEQYGWFDFLFPGYTTYLVDGKYYGLNLGMSICPVIYYNTDIFSQNNITPPKTMDELAAVAKTIEGLKLDTIQMGAMDKWPLSNLVGQILVNSMGAEKYTNLIMHCTDKNFADKVAWSDPDLIAGLEKIKELFDKGILSKNILATDYAGAKSSFESGDAAMLSDGSWGVGSLSADAPDLKFDAVPWPGWKSDVPFKMVATSANGMIIPKYTPKEKADVIADFFNFLVSKDQQVKALAYGCSPVRNDITKDEMLAQVPPATASILSSFNEAGSVEIFDMWVNTELNTVFMDAFIAYMNGTGTLQQLSEKCEAKAAELMK
jgi:ABC-type glycerol-3-phosphate transport system substrate-binding protein